LLPIELFSEFISINLLFWSFIIATFVPIITWKLR
jgi:hypothetical protein